MEHEKSKYGIEHVISCTRSYYRTHHTQTAYSPSISKRNLEKELLAMVDSHPKISFTFYLPPYHIYNYCLSHQFGEAEDLIELRRRVLLELLKRKNVKLHDFQAVPEYTCNGDYYTDIQHFSSRLAKAILRDLGNNKYPIRTPEDIEKNTAALRHLIQKNMPRFRKDIVEKSTAKKKGGK